MKSFCGPLTTVYLGTIFSSLGFVTGFSSSSLIRNLDSQKRSSTSLHTVTAGSDEAEYKESTAGCPFSMTFPRYRIPISGGKDKPGKKNIISGLFSGMLITVQKSDFERKYSNKNKEKDTSVLWYDPKIKLVSKDDKNDDEKIINGKIGVHMSAFVWRALSNLMQETLTSITRDNISKKAVIGLPNASLLGLKQLADIINWMSEEEKYFLPPAMKSKINIHASVDEESSVPTIILLTTVEKVEGENMEASNNLGMSNSINKDIILNEDIVRERTKSWVDRVLVRMRICPFTRSTTKSGQGLADKGIPVGGIAYHYSKASQCQFPMIMADTWEAISDMIMAGPSGKDGISSILLAAPEFDSDFSLWAGPLFAILEANVSAARAEPIIGIVCFHPDYLTPDGKSWPGFGHMHSVPRLQKWVKENDEDLFDLIEERDVSAGGAFQRRTPHATINVLRAEQLEAAEGRRTTASLYSTNIRRLYEEGFDKLDEDLKSEQHQLT